MNILLSGATGFIGSVLVEQLIQTGYQVYAIVREDGKHTKTNLPFGVRLTTLSALEELDVSFDAFINLAGENIASKPWTKKRKLVLRDSRITLTYKIQQITKHPITTVISMSAIGYYGVGRDDIYHEETQPNVGFAHELCRDWEKAAQSFRDIGSRVVVYRLGVVLGVGGALEKMRLPFLLGLGGSIGGGNQWFTWIHIDDVINAIMNALSDSHYSGIYNLVSPRPIQQKKFAHLYAKSLNRPAFLNTPNRLLRLLLGDMSTLLTEGSRIQPKRLQEIGFDFTFPDLEVSLLNLENRRQNR